VSNLVGNIAAQAAARYNAVGEIKETKMNAIKPWGLCLLTGIVGSCAVASAQERPAVEIRATTLAAGLFMLAGAGGNLCLAVGDDGALLIDSEYEQLSAKVRAAIKEETDQPLRFVINTHWHFDHVGGNQALTEAGAVVIAHENVRKRMSSEQVLGAIGRRVPPSPPAALPKLTYTESMMLHWNGGDVLVLHLAPAHTDGDTMVLFVQANVLHVGDVYFNGTYPFIDVNAGGSIDGMLAAVDRVLNLVSADTKIIPGHGPLSTSEELRAYRQMLSTVRDRVQALVKAGKSRDEVIAAKPTQDLDEKWGRGGMGPDVFTGVVYDGITKH
jgi:cyclase